MTFDRIDRMRHLLALSKTFHYDAGLYTELDLGEIISGDRPNTREELEKIRNRHNAWLDDCKRRVDSVIDELLETPLTSPPPAL